MIDFKDFVANSLAADPRLKAKLAKRFEIAPSTVERWAEGKAAPHAKVQKLIIEFIQSGE